MMRVHHTARRCAQLCALAAALGWSAPAGAQSYGSAVKLTNVSPAFPPGPYTSITVDPADPYRIAVGTSSGDVAWSENGGHTATEHKVLVPRRLDPMSLRAGAKSFMAFDTGGPKPRALLLFLDHLMEGRPPARQAFWMHVSDPITEISSVALGPRTTGLAAAGPAGLMVSNTGRSGWIRTRGGLGPMFRDKDMMGVSIAIDPGNPRHLLAGTDQGIMVSWDGGHTFSNHPDPKTAGDYVTRFIFDPENPSLVFAVTPDTILLSENSGDSFEGAFSTSGYIFDLNLSPQAALISAADGLHVVTSEGDIHLFQGEDKEIFGAAVWRGGSILAITSDTLYQIDPEGNLHTVARTSETDPFLALTGNENLAWVLTPSSILRIGDPVATRDRAGYEPPFMTMSQAEAERKLLDYTNLGDPYDTRFHQRWYAMLLPDVTVRAWSGRCGYVPYMRKLNSERFYRRRVVPCRDLIWDTFSSRTLMYDGAFPVGYRFSDAGIRNETEWSVFASWDLSMIAFGENANVTNPNLVLESNLRGSRDMLLAEFRWRYREAYGLVKSLQSPPADPETELLWRMRLQEYAAHLEFMCGEPIVANHELDKMQ